jgi:phosphoglycerate dehydrogenase-like enzyme
VATHEHIVVAQPGAEEQVPLLRSLHPDATWSTLPPAMPGWSLNPTLAARTTVLFADFPPTEVAGMGALRWIQLGSHGYAQFNGVELPHEVTVTNASGTNDVPIAHWCVMMLLALSRDLPGMLQAQREHRWDRSEVFQAEVTGRRVGILGYGSIGREVTRQMRSLGLEVWVMSRSGVGGRVPRYHPSGSPARAWSAPDRSFTMDRAQEFYRGLDVLVIAVPISSATAGIVDARALALLRPAALLLNPARAGVVDEAALLDALRSGRLGGAALDDHYRQPMPSDDPFFDLPRTLVTSHISGSTGSTFYEQRIWQIFRENLGRYAGGGDMLNVVARDDLELAGEAT